MLAALLSPAGPAVQAAPALGAVALPATGPTLPNPILFVTQVPTKADIGTVTTTFSNHEGGVRNAARGGDLWIRYTDGSLKNLTAAAGYGMNGFQGANAIAVRDPAVYWDGSKAVFSMVVGAPITAGQTISPVWQLYEISGFAHLTDTVVITHVAFQPASYNNVMPAYGADDHILFISDQPRAGSSLYPLLDEYNMFTTNTGLWNLDPQTGVLFQMDANPSGDFSPSVDSYGRIVFTRWDHLERDQQTDVDALSGSPCKFCTFNYASEAITATKIATNTELYPEPRPQRVDLLAGTNVEGHHMNEFLPWTINADGTGAETVNHIGRHELDSSLHPSFDDDPNLVPLYYTATTRLNHTYLTKFMQIREDPAQPGTYYGIDALELVHDSGQVISLTAPPGLDADHAVLSWVTSRDTYSTSVATAVNSSGHYRNPLPLSDGQLIAAHTYYTGFESLIPPYSTLLYSKFDFRLKTLVPGLGGYLTAGLTLTTGISESVTFWYSPTLSVSYSGYLWELEPVEVVARQRPPVLTAHAPPAPEQSVFLQAGVTITALQAYLTQNDLALVVSRNVTTRDHGDQQQPFHLQIGLTGTQTVTGTGLLYHISNIQFFQADLLRGIGGLVNTLPGRRVLAQPLHDTAAVAANPPNPGGPPGSQALFPDGSMAAFVPARRSLSWQLTDAAGTPVVRERMWVTFQPGEIRVCTSCHGLNETDQAGDPAPTNPPQALLALLQYWQSLQPQGPQLTGVLTATGTVGQPFSYTVTATGAGPITYTTSALPAGLLFASPQITGTPTLAGVTPVTLTANSLYGQDTAVLAITIQPAAPAPSDWVYLPFVIR